MLKTIAIMAVAVAAAPSIVTAKDGDAWACAMEGGSKENPIRTVTVYRVKGNWLEDSTLAKALRESRSTEGFIDTRTRSRIIEDTEDGLIAVRTMFEKADTVTQVVLHTVLINKRHLLFRSTYVALPPHVEGGFLANDTSASGACEEVSR